MEDVEKLVNDWREWKERESIAKNKRYEIELQLADALEVDGSLPGSETYECGKYKVAVTVSTSAKVDADALQGIIRAHSLDKKEAARLFRRKFEVNKKEWNDASTDLKLLLSAAIEEKTGKPYFKISEKDK